MGRNLYKLTKIFDDVIVMLIFGIIKMQQLKTDFHQTYVILGHHL